MGGSGRPSIWRSRARQDGFSLPIAVVAALLLLIGLAALGARSTQGFLASVFQGVNREARDVAESAITDFAVTLNREENRWLLVAGNDQLAQWDSNSVHRNLCSGEFVNGKYVPNTALATSASRFMRSDSWQNLISGDSSRQFRVEDVRYRYENRTAGSERADFNLATVDANIPSHTVRNAALQGGTRTLLRVTLQGRVQRNGQLSQARVTREFEVVPKCCKRSFGKHSGLGVGESDPAWGTDPVDECPLFTDDGVGRGVIVSLYGGEPDGSSNTLDIVDETNTLVTRALCWSGNETAASDLGGTPNPDCLAGMQALGKASKSVPGLTFVPMPFDLVLPRPRFGDAPGSGSGPDGGWIGSQSGVQNATLLSAAYPGSSFGNWVRTDSGKYWMRTFGSWTLFDDKTAASPAPATSPSFVGCSAALFASCRSEPALGSAPFPLADTQAFSQWPSAFPRPQLTLAGNSHLYLDPATLTMRIKSGASDTPLTNCIVSKDPAAPYAVADCRFRNIASGNDTLTVDTSYAMVNLHFDDAAYSGQVMGGGGNTTIRRVHCSRASWSAAGCNQDVTWAEYQRKCNPAAALADPNCTSGNDAYHHSELFNAYGHGPGSFDLKGTSATVGLNVYAPRASITMRGGGNANPNFMGRMWANNLTLVGNTKVRTPRSRPSFCANHRCPPPAKIPLYDMIARSFSHASGF